MARCRLPRCTLNPALRDVIRRSSRPGWQIALAAGFLHHAGFSALINAEAIPATPNNVNRLQRVADLVGFDRSQLFLGDDR